MSDTSGVIDISSDGPGGGSAWRKGTGAPSDSIGVDGDWYIDSLTANAYERVAGTYVYQCCLLGVGVGCGQGIGQWCW